MLEGICVFPQATLYCRAVMYGVISSVFLCVVWVWIVTDKAPLSKSLLLVPTALTVLLMLLQPQYQSLFEYNLQAVREDHQVRMGGLLSLVCVWECVCVME